MQAFSKQENFRLYQRNEVEARNTLKHKGITLESSDLLAILLDIFNLPSIMYADIIHMRLSVAEIVKHVEVYITGLGELLVEVTFAETIIPQDALEDDFSKAEVTVDNEKWRIHRYDADPFPSNPHAHNLSSGLKLHLGNGNLYKRRTPRGCVHRKDLLKIRELFVLAAKNVALPPLEV